MGASLSRHPAGDGAETALPSFQVDHPHVQRPIRRRVPRRPLPDLGRFPWPSPSWDRLGTLLSRPQAGPLDDACSGFTRVADRAVASASLRTRPLDHARGHRYRGPGRLPEPDLHRQAALNLSLGYVMTDSFLFMAPEQSGRTPWLEHSRSRDCLGHKGVAWPSGAHAAGRVRIWGQGSSRPPGSHRGGPPHATR
jgi:hypothetical protein